MPEEIIRVRPKPGTFALCAFPSLYLVAAAFLGSNDGHIKLSIASLLVIACASIFTSALCFHIILSRIVELNPAGLRWRTWRKTFMDTWDEVTDFHRSLGGGYIVVVGDRKVAIPSPFVNSERGHEYVVETLRERLRLPDWQLLGTRSRDFPQVFWYDDARLRHHYRIAWVVLGLIAAFVGALLDIRQIYSWGGATFLGIGFGAFLLSPIALFIAVASIRVYWASRRLYRQRFTAHEAGFIFDDGRESTVVPWESVIGYDFSTPSEDALKPWLQSNCFRIRTEQGQEFSFLACLDKADLWQEIVRKYARNGVESKIDHERSKAIGGVELCWSGGSEGRGDRVFHGRTRGLRTVIRLFAGILLIPIVVLIPPARDFLGQRVDDLSVPVFVLVVIGVFEFLLLRHYYRSRVQIGKEGITSVGLWGRRFLPWSEIVSCKLDSQAIRILPRKGKAVTVPQGYYVYESRIYPLIEEHLRDRAAKGSDMAAIEPSVADR